MRIAYLDEAGISNPDHERFMVVAAVMVHGDTRWKPVEQELYKIIEDDIPEPMRRDGFVLHASELFGGGKTLKRDEWPREKRWSILDKVVAIPDKFKLPIACFYAERIPKDLMLKEGWKTEPVITLQHAIAAIGCESQIQFWMKQNASDEVVKVTAEDHPRKKGFLKALHAIVRDPRLVEQLRQQSGMEIGKLLPFTHIIDAISFEDKKESPLLQLADACAFCMKRALMKAAGYERFLEPFHKQLIQF